MPKQSRCHYPETQLTAGIQLRALASPVLPLWCARTTIVVFNPTAGMPHASLLWCMLDVLVANGIRVELAETHWLGHAKALAREKVYERGVWMIL
jgi:hypothetical protein